MILLTTFPTDNDSSRCTQLLPKMQLNPTVSKCWDASIWAYPYKLDWQLHLKNTHGGVSFVWLAYCLPVVCLILAYDNGGWVPLSAPSGDGLGGLTLWKALDSVMSWMNGWFEKCHFGVDWLVKHCGSWCPGAVHSTRASAATMLC